MNKKLWLLALTGGAMLLTACGNPSSSDTPNTGTSNNTSNTNPGPSPITGKGIDVKINGPLIATLSRSVYVTFDKGVEPGEVVFETSDPTIAEVVNWADVLGPSGYDFTYMPEALVKPHAAGTFALRAYLKNNPSVEVKRYFDVTEVTEGEALPQATFDKLKGSLKIEAQQELCSYDISYKKTVDNEYSLTTIYEETGAASTDGQTGPLTDAYSLTETNLKTNKVSSQNYVRTSGNKIGTEYLSLFNQVRTTPYLDAEGLDHEWMNSYYTNFFGHPEIINANNFVTFDGGSTYHLVLEDDKKTMLCMSLFQSQFLADDFILMPQKDGTIDFAINVDPTFDAINKENNVKYGQNFHGKLSEFGTAAYPHIEPFAHETYHDPIAEAIKKMAALRNYKVSYTFDYSSDNTNDVTETIIFNNDTIDEVKTVGGVTSHTGIRKISENQYFKYNVNQKGQVVKTTTVNAYWHSPENRVVRYPDFRFAAEIFEKNTDGSFQTRAPGLGSAITFMSYLPGSAQYGDYENPTVITLTQDGYIASARTVTTYFDEKITIDIKFSDFTSAAHGLDFNNVIEEVVPTTWDEDNLVPSILRRNFKDWTVEGVTLDNVLPYAHSPVGYNDVVGRNNSDPAYCTIETKRFENADYSTDQVRLDAFIAAYKQALLKAGYVETNVVESHFGVKDSNRFTNDKGYSISIAPGVSWSGATQSYAVITFRVDDPAKLVYTDPSI